jgi:hypothetical protein
VAQLWTFGPDRASEQKELIMKTRTTIITLVSTAAVLTAVNSPAFSVYIPPGNIVQNGNFQSYFANWSGNVPAILGNWPTVPNDYAALANDFYQVLPTITGQQYSLSFYAAADLYFGPSVNINVALNSATLASFATPPYVYNPQVNRYEQMHWQQLTYSFFASSSTTRLEFIDMNTYDFGFAAVSVVPVPEPTSWALMLIGGIAMVIARKRCR